jgi:ribonuclease Z
MTSRHRQISVTFLGTAAVIPGPGHDTASFVLGRECLVDAGWSAVLRMTGFGLDPLRLTHLFLTHCHHDHYLGLPQLLFYRAMRRQPEPLRIAGPAGDLERVVARARDFLQADRFPEACCPVEPIPLAPGDAFDATGFSVTTCASLHPVPGLCYRFTDRHTGATVVFTGDTAYDPAIAAHARGAHLLVTEASFGARAAPAENPSLHSGAPDAARLAREADVERLALVHCTEEEQEAALARAREGFPNTCWPADGETLTVAAA